MQKTNARPTSLDAMPVCLKVDDVAAALGISRAHAYDLTNSQGFPRLAIGKRIVIPKTAFARWLEEKTVFESVQ